MLGRTKSLLLQRSSLLNQFSFAWKHTSTTATADRIAHSFAQDKHNVSEQLITVNVLDSKGYNRKIKAKIGTTLFDALQTQNLISRVDDGCDQQAVCAACHVIISNEWYNKLPQTTDYEQQSLYKTYAPVEKLTSKFCTPIFFVDNYHGVFLLFFVVLVWLAKLSWIKNMMELFWPYKA